MAGDFPCPRATMARGLRMPGWYRADPAPKRPVAQLTSLYFAIWAIVAERTPGRPRVPLPTVWQLIGNLSMISDPARVVASILPNAAPTVR